VGVAAVLKVLELHVT